MEMIFFGLLGVGFVFLGPIAFFMVLGARTRLDLAERKVKALEVRIADMERQNPLPYATQPEITKTEPLPPETAVPDTVPPEQDEPVAVTPSGQPDIPDAGMPANDQEPPATVPLPGGALPENPAQKRVESAPVKTASLEERLGTRWAVWVGGLALAIGALLLVRQAIIQGFFGPGARIVLGLLFSFALVGAGEWLRRKEAGSGDESQALDKFSFARPSIPAMLTAAGTIGAFGSVYAAHALYEFIGPALAFIALGAIGVATMFAAALHGPMLAGIGLLGAMTAPLLVASRTPSAWPVVLYIAVVAAAAYKLAQLRVWLWLALATAVGAALWSVALLSPRLFEFYHAALVHVLIQTAFALYVFAYVPWRNLRDENANPDALTSLVSIASGLVAVLVLGHVTPSRFDAAWIASAAILVAMLAASAFVSLPAIIAAVVAGLLALMALLIWPRLVESAGVVVPGIEDFPLAMPQSATGYGAFAIVITLAITAAFAWRVLRGAGLKPLSTVIYTGVAILTPFCALIIAYMRFTGGDTSTLFASLAGGLAVAFTLLAHLFRNGVRAGEPAAWNLALGLYASAAIAALALGIVMVLDGGALTVALALAALGAAFVSVQHDIPAVRWCVVGFGVAVAARYGWEPRIVSDIGPTPILNWLLFGYGVPALAFGYAARIMRLARGEDMPVRVGEALAIACSALLVFFEIRHFMNGGDPFAPASRLIETGLFAIASFAFALVLMRLDLRRHSMVMHGASYLFGIVSLAISALGLGLAANPLLASRVNPIEGGAIFNGLMLAYLLPGAMALLIGRLAEGVRPRWYVMMMRIAAVGLIFGYLSLQVRRVYQGADINLLRTTGDAEWYTYSIVWLIFGIVLLAYGLWRRSIEVRAASAIFIVLSVIKVFLFDLSGLEGVLRALSFIGLGLVLIGIGLVYQKFVFVRKQADATPPAEPAA